LGNCAACAVAKAQQKNAVKLSKRPVAETPNERVFIDLACIKKKENMPEPTMPHWLIVVDDCTQLKRVDFYKSKSDLVDNLCEMFNKDRNNGTPVRYVRCDNAGENKDRVKSVDWKLDIDFEFTARSIPQHNSLAETGLTTLLKRIRKSSIGISLPFISRFSANCGQTTVNSLVVIQP
jgi:hypothetical protein